MFKVKSQIHSGFVASFLQERPFFANFLSCSRETEKNHPIGYGVFYHIADFANRPAYPSCLNSLANAVLSNLRVNHHHRKQSQLPELARLPFSSEVLIC
jgi:hypothetical protein